MQRKTIWMLFLLIGINGLVFSCKEDDGQDIIQKADYIYINKLDSPVRLELYKINQSSKEYTLNKGDSITFVVSREGEAFPFSDNEVNQRTADSVVIRFTDKKCVSYKKNTNLSGDGVFDLTEYDNYSITLVKQDPYSLRYSIDSTDYLKAKTCF